MTETTISQATYDALVAELQELTTTGRIEIAKAIESARALGDLSENGDYHAAKDAQGKMEARIRQLEALLESAVVVSDDGATTDTVRPGLVVALRYEDDDEVSEYFLGSIEERHSGVDIVSPTSPLGQALVGAGVGDWVQYQAPGGLLKVEVVAIRTA
jgi:transcription elongation factor GreA